MIIQEKADKILHLFKENYPELRTALHFRNPFELLIAVMLSAQCTDKRVNIVTPSLFAKYPDPELMAEADIEDLKNLIRSTGFFNNKAKNIKNTSIKLVEEYNCEVPSNMEDLVSLPGVARKTANVVLSAGFQINEGMAIDTHVIRLSRQLGLTKNSDPVKIEKDLTTLFPQEEWGYIGLALIEYGRNISPARGKRKKGFLDPYFIE